MLELSAQQIQAGKLQALGRVLALTDSILTGENIECHIDTTSLVNAPAWSNGSEVFFNAEMIGNISSVEDIVNVTGLNYHELGHLLFTPRATSKIFKEVNALGMKYTFNILEDYRVETLLVGMYPAVRPYLIATFAKFCASNPDTLKTNFVLSAGRNYLPTDMKDAFRKYFERQELVEDIERIAQAYRKLVFPSDYSEALKLIKEFDWLLRGMQVKDPNGHDDISRPDIKQGSPMPQSEQVAAKENSDLDDEQFEEEDSEVRSERPDDHFLNEDSDSADTSDDSSTSGKSEESDDSEDAEDSSANDSEDMEGNSTSDSSEDSSDNSALTDSVNDSSNNQTTDTPSSAINNKIANNVQDIFNNALEDVLSNSDVLTDIKEKQDAIVNGDGEIGSDLPQAKYRAGEISVEERTAADDFACELRRLREDADPFWEARSNNGRVDALRWKIEHNFEEAFDSWNQGKLDNNDIEAVILVDTSGSMGERNRMMYASKALWSITNGLEQVNAKVTALGYDTSAVTLYNRDEETDISEYRLFQNNGLTRPSSALYEAKKIFANSDRSNQILFIITDGMWDDKAVSDAIIEDLNNNKVLTALAFIAGRYPWESTDDARKALAEQIDTRFYTQDAHNCKVYRDVFDNNDLVELATDIANYSYEMN